MPPLLVRASTTIRAEVGDINLGDGVADVMAARGVAAAALGAGADAVIGAHPHVLQLRLSARGVEGARLRRARIVSTRPVLT